MNAYSPERVADARDSRWGRSSPTERFWAKVRAEGACLVWTGSRDPKGYGRVNVGGRYWLAHRYAWFLATGAEPVGPLLHSCDNPPCVSVRHLHPGTIQENNAEALERGRVARGEAAGPSRLTERDVLAIRGLYRMGVFGYERLANLFGVSIGAIRGVVNRRTWRHLP